MGSTLRRRGRRLQGPAKPHRRFTAYRFLMFSCSMGLAMPAWAVVTPSANDLNAWAALGGILGVLAVGLLLQSGRGRLR